VLQETRAPSRCCAAGLSRSGGRRKLGAAGVPSGAAEIEESEIRLLLAHGMGVDPEGEGGVRMAELACDPPDALARGEGEAREGVPRVVQAERADA